MEEEERQLAKALNIAEGIKLKDCPEYEFGDGVCALPHS